MPSLSDISIHAWIAEHKIKTEKGDPLSFKDHMFLFDIYSDLSPLQVIMKPAQIGASTMMNVKPFWMMDKLGVDIIYTLPTDSDVVDFVGSKTNRMVAQNPIFQELTRDRDTIEQKQVGKSMIYYRGTFTKKAAMMVPADVLIHDETDASKQDIIADYETRVKHSKFKWRWYFSHPSTEGTGVHKYWVLSDQKHWFIKCHTCTKEQYLSWPESIDIQAKKYVCKACKSEISDDDRRRGRWVKKYKDRPFSGYWISSLMCPWIPASEIIQNYYEKTEEYFFTKVLGLPYVGSGNKLTKGLLFQNLTNEGYAPDEQERVVMGVDTGLKLDYVLGDKTGLFFQGEAKNYEELDLLMKRWPKMIAVIDIGGDMLATREFFDRWRGRVYLCGFRGDGKTLELISWAEGEETGRVTADRNRMIQLVVDEFSNGHIPLHGTELDWYEYANDWNNLARVKVVDATTGESKGFKWVRSGRDHRALATVYWRVGMDRFGGGETGKSIIPSKSFQFGTAPVVSLDGRIPADKRVLQMPAANSSDDWRNV